MGNVVASGGAPFNVDASFDNGVYSVYAEDSYGDGWNGNYLTITGSDGTEYLNYTLDDGSEGSAAFEVNASDPISWISLSQTSGSVIGGESDYIEVIFNSNELEEGMSYYCEMNVNANVGIITIPVMLTVGQGGDYSVDLMVLNDQDNFQDLTFGTHPSATNGYDANYDLYSPPPPPPPSFSAALFNIHDNDRYLRDIRPTTPEDGATEWRIDIQAGESSYFILEWDIDELGEGGNFFLRDVITGGAFISVNMREAGSVLIDNPSLSLLSITHGYSSTIVVGNLDDWNLIGLPLNVPDEYYLSVFPSAVENTCNG